MATFLEQIQTDADNITSDTTTGVAEAGSYTPKGETEKTGLTFIVSRNNYNADFPEEGEKWQKTASIYVKRSDVDQPDKYDKVTLSDGTWQIMEVLSQNAGGSTCNIMLITTRTVGHISR